MKRYAVSRSTGKALDVSPAVVVHASTVSHSLAPCFCSSMTAPATPTPNWSSFFNVAFATSSDTLIVVLFATVPGPDSTRALPCTSTENFTSSNRSSSGSAGAASSDST